MPAMGAPMNRAVDTFAAAVGHLESLHLRHDADVGVILVQVDQLARINNAAGTAAGDAVLEETTNSGGARTSTGSTARAS